MTNTENLTKYQQHLIQWAKDDAAKKSNDWPGFPLTQIPLAAKDDLHQLIRAGLLRIVERPSVRLGTAAYVVATDA